MAARRDDAPSVRIIGHKRYILEKRNLVCEAYISNPKLIFDWYARTVRLYYPQGKEFMLETTGGMCGYRLETKIISEKEAHDFMDAYPDGIIEKVYVKFFGEPEEL